MISLLYYRWLQEKKSRWTHKMPLCHVLPRQLAADGPFHASVLHFLLKTPIWRAYFSRRRDRKNYQLLLCCSSGPPQKLMAWEWNVSFSGNQAYLRLIWSENGSSSSSFVITIHSGWSDDWSAARNSCLKINSLCTNCLKRIRHFWVTNRLETREYFKLNKTITKLNYNIKWGPREGGRCAALKI